MEEESRTAAWYVTAQFRFSRMLLTLVHRFAGVFLVNSDSAILMAMFRDIASEFGQLGGSEDTGSWRLTVLCSTEN
jgi:hypothetical protein